MSKILIVDDEAKIREVLTEYALFEGFEVETANDGFEAIAAVRDKHIDIIIMDIMMSRLDGLSAVKKIKEIKDIPVLMLSARGEEYDKLYSFELGADDYIVKPFSPKEVMARVKAILRRVERVSQNQTYEFEGLRIDEIGRNVYVDEQKISLTPKEYDLLFYFVRNRGIALSREKLLSEIWGYDYFGDDRTIDTHIKMLRNSLGEYSKFICTLRGMGYKFEV
ncbi:MAG: response regulator transcription factor [Clostridia bacterium]|nr:response regulator transcription factor [Clostridia bacterium]